MLISDGVGNQAKARTLIFVDPSNTIEVSRDVTVRVSQGVTRGNVIWVDDSTSLTLNWVGVFSNPTHVRSNYLAEVDEMEDTLEDTRADDGKVKIPLPTLPTLL